MKSRAPVLASLVLSAVACFAQYRVARPGYHYEFPRDHFNHPDFQTEWWYYTGNVKAADGHRFGFELTFFRQGVHRQGAAKSPWTIEDLYFAHLALSDLEGGKFYHTERFNRAGPDLAGASLEQMRLWNGNWQVQWSQVQHKADLASHRRSLRLAFRDESGKASGSARRERRQSERGWRWARVALHFVFAARDFGNH
jgi:predicted secreted hydrolase